ncbi:plasmid partitioning/stability family protein (plasmid) [Kosakonia sp. ML.JS2a]|uniref:plasmid partitioning/stability family protein n=1 Tax=Kosakonia sp. ML.JS2a TaxID=2980557 RepID=UPI0021DAB837|nr:plasmid partitioning/stability family protein [Kosakonia sp. ML.JS2a]UXY13599.1 plasmid partitioning/stability family protein [Kosakonia sp. ML.JS2a]
MPAGKYSFYLHADDRTDILAAGTLDNVSQPLRGEFLRTAAIAGSVLYRIDNRLPGLVTELFDGQLRYGQLVSLLASLSGQYYCQTGPEAEPLPAVKGQAPGQTDKTERRRFTLLLPDNPESRQVAALLEETSSRLRGVLLRNLIIAGFALHTLDPRLPRLLSSMPTPPESPAALSALAGEIAGITAHGDAGTAVVPVAGRNDTASGQSVVRKNMKNLF